MTTNLNESLDLEYEDLPVAVKAAVTAKEYRWMLQSGREQLVQSLTEPEVENDS